MAFVIPSDDESPVSVAAVRDRLVGAAVPWGTVVVVVAVDDDCEHPDTTMAAARAAGRKRFIAWTKLGDATPSLRECSE